MTISIAQKSDPVLASRSYWLDFLYHITDIENAANILESGFLYSRAALERNGLIWEDAASSAVISQTRQQTTEYVRLYFRPKTPTGYLMEGIRPLNRRYAGNAHCPVPVYFIFDIRDTITLQDSRFGIRDLQLRFDLSAIGWQEYTFTLEVDGKLAYLGHYTPEIPF